jgi:hypothetical protein
MAMRVVEGEVPFLALVGHTAKPTWSEAAVAYATYYLQISKGRNIAAAVDAMNAAACFDHGEFKLANGKQTFDLFAEVVRAVNAQDESAFAAAIRRLPLAAPERRLTLASPGKVSGAA